MGLVSWIVMSKLQNDQCYLEASVKRIVTLVPWKMKKVVVQGKQTKSPCDKGEVIYELDSASIVHSLMKSPTENSQATGSSYFCPVAFRGVAIECSWEGWSHVKNYLVLSVSTIIYGSVSVYNNFVKRGQDFIQPI